MKNIHLIPTDKPSRLCKDEFGKFYVTELMESKISFFKNQHIYITSDEEIERGDCILLPNNEIIVLPTGLAQVPLNNFIRGYSLSDCKKIILTTNQDLIKDGVQAIDDEFLKWFVKNPSCKEVEIINWFGGMYPCKYKIKIPKEEELSKDEIDRLFIDMVFNPKKEHKQDRTCSNNCSDVCGECQILQPKQETLEEAAKKYATLITKKWIKGDVCNSEKEDIIVHFVSGAKWQQERSYSEEEVKNLIKIIEWYDKESDVRPNYTPDIEERIGEISMWDWFEQFKKK